MFLVCASRSASLESKPRGEYLIENRSLVMAEEYKVHVGSLSYDTDEDSLEAFFENTIKLRVVAGK